MPVIAVAAAVLKSYNRPMFSWRTFTRSLAVASALLSFASCASEAEVDSESLEEQQLAARFGALGAAQWQAEQVQWSLQGQTELANARTEVLETGTSEETSLWESFNPFDLDFCAEEHRAGVPLNANTEHYVFAGWRISATTGLSVSAGNEVVLGLRNVKLAVVQRANFGLGLLGGNVGVYFGLARSFRTDPVDFGTGRRTAAEVSVSSAAFLIPLGAAVQVFAEQEDWNFEGGLGGLVRATISVDSPLSGGFSSGQFGNNVNVTGKALGGFEGSLSELDFQMTNRAGNPLSAAQCEVDRDCRVQLKPSCSSGRCRGRAVVRAMMTLGVSNPALLAHGYIVASAATYGRFFRNLCP